MRDMLDKFPRAGAALFSLFALPQCQASTDLLLLVRERTCHRANVCAVYNADWGGLQCSDISRLSTFRSGIHSRLLGRAYDADFERGFNVSHGPREQCRTEQAVKLAKVNGYQ